MNIYRLFPPHAKITALLCCTLVSSLSFTSCDLLKSLTEDEEDEPVAVTGIKLSHDNISGEAGEQHMISATVYPEDADNKDVVWNVENTDIAYYIDSNDGDLVHLNAVGKTVLTVTTVDGGFTAQCEIEVRPTYAYKIEIAEKDGLIMIPQMQYAVHATVCPENATDKTLIWSSENQAIASVDEKGMISAHSPGRTAITVQCTAEEGMIPVSETVIVDVEEKYITVDLGNYTSNVTVSFQGGSAGVFWGDGTADKYDRSDSYTEITHKYEDLNQESGRQVIIAGARISKFKCSQDDNIIGINVSHNPSLIELSCSETGIRTLDLSKNEALEKVFIQYNENLSELTLGNHPSLHHLNCSSGKLKNLHLKRHADNMMFDCGYNGLESLVIDKGEEDFSYLDCSGNNLTRLDLHGVQFHSYMFLYYNNFEAAALNDIFSAAQDVTEWDPNYTNMIVIGRNPGTEGCDTSIATDKGWDVRIERD